MKRNSNFLFLTTGEITTVVPWVDNAPDFSDFTEPTLSVLRQSWQDLLDSGDALEIIPDPEPIIESPQPNWDGFNAAMIASQSFNQFYSAVNAISPLLASSIPTALAQVSTNGVAAFSLVWGAACQVGGATIQQRNEWANIAENFNLPADFVAVVRG